MKTLLRFLRHPVRTIDSKLWKHYAPDVSPLIQQIADLGGTVQMPPGRWKSGATIRLRAGNGLAAARTAEAARADVRQHGGKSPLRGGLDLCGPCVKAGREPEGRHAETGPLAARQERLSA